jgi:hypothetical protein
MAFDVINLGTVNQGDGDTLRAGGVKINANFAKAVEIQSGGRVGIGTTSPAARLQVSGSETVSSQVNVAAVIGANIDSELFLGSVNGNNPFVAAEGAFPLSFFTNAVERMRITGSGDVGIGVSPATKFHVDGTIRYTNRPAAGTITAIGFDTNGDLKASSSSLRYKHDVVDYEKGLDVVNALRPVSFSYNGETRENIGFIAEEVDELGLPEVMLYDDAGQPEGVLYANMVALLTKAVQELSAQVVELRAEVLALQTNG